MAAEAQPQFEPAACWSWRRQLLPRRGFFTRAFAVEEGPFAGWLEKRLHNRLDAATAVRHREEIERYAATLRQIGLRVAETRVFALPAGRRWRVTLFQERFPEADLVTARVAAAAGPECLELLARLLAESARVLDYKRAEDRRSERELGFHSSLRNWGLKDGRLCFFDLTPPLWRQDGRPWPRSFLRHAPARFAPLRFYPLGDFFFRLATRDSFDPRVLFAGLVTSTVRRRPELRDQALAVGREAVARHVPPGEQEAFLELLDAGRLKRHRGLNAFYRRLFPA